MDGSTGSTRKMYVAEDAGEGCWMEGPDPFYRPWWCDLCGQKNPDAGPYCMFCKKHRHKPEDDDQ